MLNLFILFILLYSVSEYKTQDLATTTELSLTPENPNEIDLTNTKSWTWQTEHPYLNKNVSVSVVTCNDHKISVTVSNIDIDGANKDYLLIKGSDELEKSQVFTYTIGKTMRFLYNTNQVYGNFVVNGNNSNNNSGFTVLFERVDEKSITTTIPTTTGKDFPTPQPGESSRFTVYIIGKTFMLYKNDKVLDSFRKSVAEMAGDYCKLQNIYVKENVTENNVLIDKYFRCPMSWPDSDDCVEITFSVPVILDETSHSGYQMTTGHLRIMWDRYASKYFHIYTQPDADGIFVGWITTIVIIVILFIVTLWLFKTLGVKYSLLNRRRLSETATIISSKRDSNTSMGPHYLQDTPKFFENAYPMYHPGEED